MTEKDEEKVLFFIKPDGIIRRAVGARVLEEIKNEGFEIFSPHLVTISRDFYINIHYNSHRDKFFFEWLIDYVTLSPIIVMILKGSNIIAKIKEKLGYTIPTKAQQNTIRGHYGIYGGINVAHCSDSKLSANREIEEWEKANIFNSSKELNVEDYMDKYLEYYLNDSLKYRLISTQLSNNEISVETARLKFIELLNPETDFCDETKKRFVDLLIRNALLRRGG